MLKVFGILSTLIFSGVSWGDIYVVTNINNPHDSLSKQEVRDFYLGRRRSFAEGNFTAIYDRKADSELRAKFFRALTGMQLRQVDAFWARLVFAGRMLPLKEVENNSTLEELIANEVNSIGYMSSKPTHDQLKTLMIISTRSE